MSPTPLILSLLTLAALAAWAMEIGRLRQPEKSPSPIKPSILLLALVMGGSAAVFVYRAWMVHGGWQPLQAHVDGLLLIAAIFAAVVLYLQTRPKLRGVGAFALPVLILVLAWSICASAWTFHPFQIHSVWKSFHLLSVYLGTLCFAVAAISGGMFLYVQRHLRTKRSLTALGRMASLERLESLIIRASALGFGLLTLGLATGFIILAADQPTLRADWWYSPKIVLALLVWLIYALVMNVRHTTHFRGARAAWLSILGLLLLLATFAVVTALPPVSAVDGTEEENKPIRSENNAPARGSRPQTPDPIPDPLFQEAAA